MYINYIRIMSGILAISGAALSVSLAVAQPVPGSPGGPELHGGPPSPPRPPAADFAVLPLTAADRAALAPEIAAGPDGTLHVIWVDNGALRDQPPPGPPQPGAGPAHRSATDLYYAQSQDGGWNWSRPVRVNSEAGAVWGMSISRPRIAVGASGTVHVAYPANEISTVTGKSIIAAYYARATDGGRSFEKSRRLNQLASGDLSSFIHGGYSQAHAFAALAAGPDKSVYAFWIDTREMQGPTDNGGLYAAISRDDGKTFATDVPVFRGDVCPCCQITAHVDAQSRLLVGSRQVTAGGFRDATVSRSDDGGRTFAPRVNIGGAHWKIEGCPLKPIAVNRDGDFVYASVYAGGEQEPGAYFARSLDGGRTFTDYLALHPGAVVSDAPAIAATGAAVHVLWHAKVGPDKRLFARSSADHGATFGPPVALPTPPGNASLPAVAMSRDGNVAAVWQQGSQVFFGRYRPAAEIRYATAAELRAKLDEQRGRVVILNLWATWCVSCLREIPDLVGVAGEFARDGVVLLGVAMDEPRDLESLVKPFHAKYFPAFATLMRREAEMDTMVSVVDPAWNEVMPTTYILDRRGRVLVRLQGQQTPDELRARVRAALATKQT